ncbi:hypothetical protein N0M98_33125 [Paenibacillus doosanensis]|uniref:Uncharacterized protein n=1 Tax=Paenibacillus konkukensis TaxID=2020716 RepID=A0ABY4RQW7_9BACL|nr:MULTISPECIES: hypothetical protein [Paenibacillus]MCS7464927.1 hypothetical protein [Paenibacillus doosanensis]UQZ83752.1 hypothetical protein SK3146_02959 [Paenibacillus konkukensis]
MTEVNQHQMPLRHVIDNAEKAIQVAKDAEMAVRHAQLESNPNKLASAVAQLETAQRAVQQAQSQIDAQLGFHHHQHEQELKQVQEQLNQSLQSVEIVGDNTQQPKQMR